MARRELGEAIAELASGDTSGARLASTGKLAASSARAAGARAVATGRWLAETLLDAAPHLPIRDLPTLREHYGGLSGAALADSLIRSASRASAAVGAISGAMISAEEVAPPSWVAVPFELVVETVVVAAIEIKLIAELHAVHRRPIVGTPGERSAALARAWAERRGVSPTALTGAGLGEVLGRSTRREVSRLLQRRLALRTARNTVALAPFLAGAVAGAEVNRRATRALGEAVVRDLAHR